MTVRVKTLAAFFAAMVVLAAPAIAEASDQQSQCGRAALDLDRQIESCTVLIESQTETKDVRGVAYHNRGNAWLDKGDFKRAIADYSEAIKIDPRSALSYRGRALAQYEELEFDEAIADFNQAIELNPRDARAYLGRGRAWHSTEQLDRAIADFTTGLDIDPNDAMLHYSRAGALETKGESDRALADLDEAIRLDPKLAAAYEDRGYIRFNRSDFAGAVADLEKEIELESSPWASLWRYLALRHLGRDGNAVLAADAVNLKSRSWPYPVIEFYLGQREAMDMVSAAPSSRVCTAWFYLGEWLLLSGRRTEAEALLRASAETCPNIFIETSGAAGELRRLKTAKR